MFRTLLFIVSLLLILTSCRYWSLYKFADQFCDFNEHISVTQKVKSTHIDFLDPVLPRALLLRYLHAQPVLTSYKLENANQTPLAVSDTFFIQRTHSAKLNDTYAPFEFKLSYHFAGDTPLVSEGSLDAELSALFSTKTVVPILKSICSDDYDLSLKRLDMRFTLSDIHTKDLPLQKEFITIFGEPDINEVNSDETAIYQYRFDFVQKNGLGNNVLQNRPIDFTFEFDRFGKLGKLHILYYKYDYVLDFEHQNGRLVVNRG